MLNATMTRRSPHPNVPVCHIRRFEAFAAVGLGTTRGQRPGFLRDIRSYLFEGIDLSGIPIVQEDFQAWLDQRTQEAMRAVAGRPRREIWGVARKCVNLFLRACVYNHYLREAYPHLCKIVQLLEVPLDSRVGAGLQKASQGLLPPWPGLNGLTSRTNKQFQEYAKRYAAEKDYPARVFVDHELWLTKELHECPRTRPEAAPPSGQRNCSHSRRSTSR